MIREVAELRITRGSGPDFEAAVARAVPLFRRARGCRGMHLERVIETPDLYRLIVFWDSVEDHMEGFQKSEDFQTWRGLAGPFFAEKPRMDHSEPVIEGFSA